MFKLAIAERCIELLKHPGGNGGLAEAQTEKGLHHPPLLAESGGNHNRSPKQSAKSATPGGLASPVTARLPANPPNPPTPQHKIRGHVIDLRAYLLKLCQQLPMPPEHLLQHYFTADDLADIRAGRLPDPYALADFIKTDPRYPFA